MSIYIEQRKEFWKKHVELVKKERIIEIRLTEEMLQTAETWAKKVISEKKKEKNHKEDHRNQFARWRVGCLGELALGNHLGISIHEEAIGLSHHFDVPDLRKSLHIDCGIKSFTVGNFPLTNRIRTGGGLFKANAHPQIFISIDEKSKTSYLYGFASLELLSMNERNSSNNDYVKDKNALKRKIAFTQLEHTQLFKDKEELANIVHKSKGDKMIQHFIF